MLHVMYGRTGPTKKLTHMVADRRRCLAVCGAHLRFFRGVGKPEEFARSESSFSLATNYYLCPDCKRIRDKVEASPSRPPATEDGDEWVLCLLPPYWAESEEGPEWQGPGWYQMNSGRFVAFITRAVNIKERARRKAANMGQRAG